MRSSRMVFPRILLVAALAVLPAITAAQQQVPTLITQAIDETQLTVLKGNTHPLALPQYDRGPAPSSLPLNRMLLVLQRSPDQEAALETLLDQQQDKLSPNYRQWLTPEQFGQQFGLADQDIQTVTSWLESHGFQVNHVSKGRSTIEFSGNAGELQQAFHTEIHKYNVNGQEHWANATDPQIPIALSPAVAGTASLNNFPLRPMIHVDGAFSRSKATARITPVKPLLTISNGGCGVSGTCYGIGPFDFATIYNLSTLWNSTTPIDGTGQIIAIVGETDINPQDLTDFRNFFGMPAPNVNVIHDGPAPGILTDGEESESDLDIEWAGAIAKGATIDFVVSEATETTSGVDLSAEYIIDNNLAPVMSESYGECELGLGTAGNQFFSQLWQQAAAQGISVFVSAGDNGSAGCDNFDATQRPAPSVYGLEVNGIASTPYNVAAGGTDFNDALNPSLYWTTTNAPTTQQSAISYIPEDAWNNTCTNPIFASLGFTGNAETNCNDSRLVDFVSTIGGSGGTSGCTTPSSNTPSSCSGGYAKPSWQTGSGVPSDGKRDIPDVSLYAAGAGSPSGAGYIVCEADIVSGSSCDPSIANTDFLLVGGTSASSPELAGIMALINQKTGVRQGNPNYTLYKLAAQSGTSCTSIQNPSSTCVFYDVPQGSTNAMPCASGSSPTCNVATGGDSFGVLSGYSTTSGYDQATGLGSVNVGNLVTQWSNFQGQFRTTNTTLVLTPPASTAHGQPWTVAATVTAQTGTGTPTGTITLVAETGPSTSGQDALPQVFQLSGGSLPPGTTTAFLPGGTYTVTAYYSGDTTFAPSDSAPVPVTVSAEASKLFANLVTFDVNGNLTSFSANGATYGSGFYLLRVDVGDSSSTYSASTGIASTCAKQTASCPTGTVSLSSTGTALNTGSLPLNIKGYAEDQSLATGSYSISASYPGDSSYGSSSTTAVFTIAKAPTTVNAGPLTAVPYGNSTQIGATILTTSEGAAPTGTVSFSLDGAPLQVPNVVYEGFPYEPNNSPPSYATLSATGLAQFLSLGNHSLTAQYSGDNNYAGATSAAASVTVTQAQPEFTSYGANPNSINLNQSVTLTASMYGSAGGVAPTGTMTFYDNNTPVSGTVTYTPSNASGLTGSSLQATMPYTPTTPGAHNITVSYSGDTNYLSATTPTPATLTVVGPDFTMSTQPPSTTVTAGNPATYTLAIAGTDGFTGNVSVTCSLSAAATTCAANPTPVAVGANTTITVTTTAHQLVRPTPFTYRLAPRLPIVPVVAVLLFMIWALVFSATRTKRPLRVPLSLAAVFFLFVVALEGCGGGNSQSSPPHGTQPGVYTVTVTGTSGSLTHTTTVSLTVQ